MTSCAEICFSAALFLIKAFNCGGLVSSRGLVVASTPRWGGPHCPGRVNLRSERPGITGAMGSSTSWNPWPRPVTRAAVGTQECTQIGENGPTEPFRGVCVHCCAVVDRREAAGVYTDRRKWPLGAIFGHLCTLLGRELRQGAQVASGSASGAAARLASSQGINPHKPSRSPSSCPGDLASRMRYALADLTAATAAAILCGSLTRFVSRAVFMSMPQGLRRSIASGIVWTERPPARM